MSLAGGAFKKEVSFFISVCSLDAETLRPSRMVQL